MLTRIFSSILCLIFTSPLWSITCYFTLVKDNCWAKYDVTVDVMDAVTAKVLTTANVLPGQFWVRQTFPCEAREKLMYNAHFSPIIWESEQGKTYSAKRYWSLPDVVNPDDSAWNVTVCYSSDFSQVPLPPEAISSCKCNFDEIPKIPPKKI